MQTRLAILRVKMTVLQGEKKELKKGIVYDTYSAKFINDGVSLRIWDSINSSP